MGKREKPGSASPSGEVRKAGGRSLGLGGGIRAGEKAAEALGEAGGGRVLRAKQDPGQDSESWVIQKPALGRKGILTKHNPI